MGRRLLIGTEGHVERRHVDAQGEGATPNAFHDGEKLGPPPPFMVMGAIALAIGWISFRAMGRFPAEARRS